MKLRASDVFKPGSFPQYTYVTRKSAGFNFTYEMRLKQALNTPGFLTSIVGPSKTGKTVLCEKVVGIDNIIALTGNDFKDQTDFWQTIANKVGISIEGEHIENTALKASLGVAEERSVSTKERYLLNKDKVIQYFKEQELVLVIDDFHYAPEKLQFDIAYQLKDAIRKEFKAIIISLPHRADDAIRKNSDLSGRLNLINIEPWQQNELKEIAIKGFEKLNVQMQEQYAAALAMESLTSPQLMQSICLNLSLILDIDSLNINTFENRDVLEDSYRFTTINLPYQDVVKKLIEGPSTRGQQRTKFLLNDGSAADIYQIILKAIAANPPTVSVTLEEMKQRVDSLLAPSAEKIEKNKIKLRLQKLNDVMQANGQIYQVFEFKDSHVFILDPLFLFYLRWGNY